MPATQSTTPNSKESMYFYMLDKELEDSKQKFLQKAIFNSTDQKALLSNIEHRRSSGDMPNGERPQFLAQLIDLLEETTSLKIDQTVLDNMLKSLFKAASSKQQQSSSSSAHYKVAFVQALLSERTFFINLVRSLLGLVRSQQESASSDLISADKIVQSKPVKKPQFQKDPFLQDEFSKVTQVRSQSSLQTATHAKSYSISRLLQPTNHQHPQYIEEQKGLSTTRVLLNRGGAESQDDFSAVENMTTYSAKSNHSKLLARAAAATQSKTMFDRFHPSSAVTVTENNEYSANKRVDDSYYRKDCFSFAENFTSPEQGVYKAEGNKVMVGLAEHRSDIASNSPSFGNLSSKSPHSHQAAIRKSRKKNVLSEYNHLFKRKETVQLKHKWETDDEDGAADVTSSSSDEDIDDQEARENGENKAVGAHSAGDDHLQTTTSREPLHDDQKTNTSPSQHQKTPSVNTRRVQKPEHKNLIIGKRANVRTSDRRGYSKLLRSSNSRSPKNLSKQYQRVSAKPQSNSNYSNQQQSSQQQSLFSQNKKQSQQQVESQKAQAFNQKTGMNSAVPNHPPPSVSLQSQIRNKVSSRNSKTGDLYTKSVPSLGNDKAKGSKEISSVTSNEVMTADKKSKLLKDASLQLAMTLSPKSTHHKAMAASRQNHQKATKMANPQYTSQTKFERTYQSISSQKKAKANQSRSPESSNCSKEKSHGRRPTKRTPKVSEQRRSNSPYRYTDEEYKESMCEPHDLEKQLRQEQEFEYASHQSSSLHNMKQQRQGPLVPTENGAIPATDTTISNKSSSVSIQRKSDNKKHSQQKRSSSEQQDEYELLLNQQKTNSKPSTQGLGGRKLVGSGSSSSAQKTGTQRQRGSAVGQSSAKQSQSKLLATSTMSNQIIEGPTQPKKLEKDAKLLFPPSQNVNKKSKLSQDTSKVMSKQNSMPVGLSAAASSNSQQTLQRRNNQPNKSGRGVDQRSADVQGHSHNANHPQNGVQHLMQQSNTRYTSDAGSMLKQSPKVVTTISKRTVLKSSQNAGSVGSNATSQSRLNQNFTTQAAATTAYGGIKLNVHHESSQASSFQQVSNVSQQNPGAFPVLQHSEKSPTHDKKSVQSDNNSCYDEDDEANGKRDEENSHIARYTQEIMADRMFSSGQLGMGSLSLEDGPQTFEKESEDDADNNVRQQIVFVDDSGANGNDLKISIAQNIDENHAQVNSSNRPSQLRSQVHELFYSKPSESVAQSYQHLQEDFEDEDAMFEHLNSPDTNQDGRSRQETFDPQSELSYQRESIVEHRRNLNHGDLSDKDRVSFNLDNMSGIIKHSNINNDSRMNAANPQHQLAQGKKLTTVAGMLSSHGSSAKGSRQQLQQSQFSVHKLSNNNTISEPQQCLSSGTQNTLRNTKLKHNMSVNNVKTGGNVHQTQSSQNQSQYQSKATGSSKHHNETTVRSVSIDLLQNNNNNNNNNSQVAEQRHYQNSREFSYEQQQKKQSSNKSKHSAQQNQHYSHTSSAQQSKKIHQPAPMEHPNTQNLARSSQHSSLNQQYPIGQAGSVIKRDQTIVSQDFFSEDSMAGQSLGSGAVMADGHQDNVQKSNQRQLDERDADDDGVEDAERVFRLSQVRMELLKGQEIRNSRLGKFSNRHMSSSSSERSCSSAQFKNQLNSIRIGSQEQSPNAKQQRLKKQLNKKKPFFGVDSSNERDAEELPDQEFDQYGAANTHNAVHEYSIVNVKNKQNSRAKQAVASLQAAFSPAGSHRAGSGRSNTSGNHHHQQQNTATNNHLQQKRQSLNKSNRHYFSVSSSGLGSDQDVASSNPSLSSQQQQQQQQSEEHLHLDDSYNKFLTKQKSRRL